MTRPALKSEDLARIDPNAVAKEIILLLRVVESLAYTPPEAATVWQARLDRAAALMSAIADGLRLTPPGESP